VKIYFEPKDLSCLIAVRRDYFPTAKMYFDGDEIQKPCILFTFIPVGARMDHVGWPEKTKMLSEISGGRSVVVRVHEESSQCYDDISLDYALTSGILDKNIVLKAKYRTKWNQTGMDGALNEQVFY